jgi:hypothetical protein
MLHPRLLVSALFASSALACSHGRPPAAPTQLEAEQYVIIQPDVSVSATAREAEQKTAALDPNADVMAEIMAIPPGH